MIQRKQTLFLFQLIFLGIALMFLPVKNATIAGQTLNPTLVPIAVEGAESTVGHMTAIFINFGGLILTFVTVFLYKRRKVQVKLSYTLLVLWLVLTLMILFCPFVKTTVGPVTEESNYFGVIVGIFSMLAAYLSARYIKKDIELLKSADRIR